MSPPLPHTHKVYHCQHSRHTEERPSHHLKLRDTVLHHHPLTTSKSLLPDRPELRGHPKPPAHSRLAGDGRQVLLQLPRRLVPDEQVAVAAAGRHVLAVGTEHGARVVAAHVKTVRPDDNSGEEGSGGYDQ